MEHAVQPNGATPGKDIQPGSDGALPNRFIDVNGTAFFAASDGVHGFELWKSDGTAAGTVLVKDIASGFDGLDVFGGGAEFAPINVNGTLFFQAFDLATGFELWKSDGTEGGTVLVKDINSGSGSSSPFDLTNVNGTLFFTANDGASGIELWKSDGTAAGTVLVANINSGSASAIPVNLTNVNGTLFFWANDGVKGVELWKSDGTATGIVLVKDIKLGGSGARATDPFQETIDLVNVNGTLFFQANDGAHGTELWKSDGTAAGTVLVKDVQVGVQGSVTSNLTNIDGTLFFTADDGVHGRELWASGLAANLVANDTDPDSPTSTASLGTGPTNGTLILNPDGTFTYRPNEGFIGTDTFTYTVSDGTQSSRLATVTITVTA